MMYNNIDKCLQIIVWLKWLLERIIYQNRKQRKAFVVVSESLKKC